MARPRYAPDEQHAVEKIEEAFWELLAQGPFSSITVKGLARTAGVNHNTFYYHFENMEALAAAALEETAPFKSIVGYVPQFLMSGVVPLAIERDDTLQQAFSRVKLFAKPDSPELSGMIRRLVLKFWFDALGVDEKQLGDEERKSITFLIGGAMAVLGDFPEMELTDFISLLHGSVGTAARGILTRLGS